MDISSITDAKELKALAYDTLQAVEVQQNNLRLIQQRIAEIEQQAQETEKKK
ncbi:MAG: hypothetical protein H6797_00845 [Candidatus Nomurabacteria bacterium]|nr:MAG: hypothetical protein H6797_00845 [Candidatus Nomurabacteria bacterium]